MHHLMSEKSAEIKFTVDLINFCFLNFFAEYQGLVLPYINKIQHQNYGKK